VKAAADELGDAAIVLAADAASESDMRAAIDRARALGDGIDVLFLNAGIVRPAPITDMDVATFDATLAVNLKGPWLTLKAAIPHLRPGASVILNTSVASTTGGAGLSAYAASKAGLRSLARTASRELVGRGVRVNALSPGPIDTPIYDKLGLPPEAGANVKAQMLAAVPLGRMGTPAEIARAALYLASDDSAFMVGAELVLDGGGTQL
jgi:NAD(P)-dependent dehydrogenase (short-subunit alcohol dehydrogenase family)